MPRPRSDTPSPAAPYLIRVGAVASVFASIVISDLYHPDFVTWGWYAGAFVVFLYELRPSGNA